MRIRFPDSEICGSKGARPSPQLIAACYVLHRLCVPRHPPDALALTLDRSAFRSMPRKKTSAGGCWIPKMPGYGIHAISLECRIQIHRSCKPANPAFTMSTSCRSCVRVGYASACPEVDCSSFRRLSPLAGSPASLLRSFAVAGFASSACQGVACGSRRSLVEPIGIEPMTSSLQS